MFGWGGVAKQKKVKNITQNLHISKIKFIFALLIKNNIIMVNIDNVLKKMRVWSEYIDYTEFENNHDGLCYCTVTFVHLNHLMSPETSNLIHAINQFIIDFDGILSRESTACCIKVRFDVQFFKK